MGMTIGISIKELELKEMDKYASSLYMKRLDFVRIILQEYLQNHPIENNDSMQDYLNEDKGKTVNVGFYIDKKLLNIFETERCKRNWNKITTTDFAVKETFDKIKELNVEEIDNKLKNIDKTKIKKLPLHEVFFNQLKEWCKENNHSMTKIFSLALVMYFEEHSEEGSK